MVSSPNQHLEKQLLLTALHAPHTALDIKLSSRLSEPRQILFQITSVRVFKCRVMLAVWMSRLKGFALPKGPLWICRCVVTLKKY